MNKVIWLLVILVIFVASLFADERFELKQPPKDQMLYTLNFEDSLFSIAGYVLKHNEESYTLYITDGECYTDDKVIHPNDPMFPDYQLVFQNIKIEYNKYDGVWDITYHHLEHIIDDEFYWMIQTEFNRHYNKLLLSKILDKVGSK
jgi:hypothetical protein